MMVYSNRLRTVNGTSPKRTRDKAEGNSVEENVVKNPNVPIWNEITGGMVVGKREEAKRSVPSPPRVITKSTRLLRL